MAVQKTPSCNHFKNCNARSIKPIHYNGCKLNNYKMKHTNKKGKGQSGLVICTLPFYKQNVRTLYITKCIQSLANEINYKLSGNFYCTGV